MSLDNINLTEIKRRVADACRAERGALDELRRYARVLNDNTKPLKTCSANTIAFVAADGGDNRLRIDAGAEFNPAMVELVRVVDSNRNECALDAVAGHPDFAGDEWRAVKPLARLCDDVGMELSALSPYLKLPQRTAAIQAYREIVEWAVVYYLAAYKEWGSDTMLVHEGPLRSRVFCKEAFEALDKKFREAFARHKKSNITLSLVGISKSSVLLSRLSAALTLEGVLEEDRPCRAHVPLEIAQKFYERRWLDTMETAAPGREYLSMGDMHLVKFGNHSQDPVWPVDVAMWQKEDADTVLGQLANDARPGFPIPDFPMSVQRAHDYARIDPLEVSLLGDILLDEIADPMDKKEQERIFRLKYLGEDLTRRRYQDA